MDIPDGEYGITDPFGPILMVLAGGYNLMTSRIIAVVSGSAFVTFGSSLSRFAASAGSGPRMLSCSALTSSKILGWRDSS